jgi:hypothetical protein
VNRIRDWAYDHGWPTVLADRVSQVMWVLDHEADIDADFLAIYGLDLEHVEITGPRYFALAHRLTAYQGVMAARVDEERDDPPPQRASTTPTRTSSTAPPARQGDSETAEVSLTQFRMQFPGLVSVAQGG